MSPFLKNLYTSLIVLTFLFSLPYQLRATPVVSLSLNKDTIVAHKIFLLELTVSWKGDADQYLVAPPQVTLPEGIEERGSSFSSTSKGEHYLLNYKYNLCAQKEGEYILTPIEISYWEKGNNKEEKMKTETIHFQVTSFSTAFLGGYWLLGFITTIFLGLFTILIVLYKKQKRSSVDQGADSTVTRETMVSELGQSNAYKIKGDWENYLKKVISIRDKLPTQDKAGKIMGELDTLAERVTYGGFHPTAEEIDLIQRQLEKAFKSAFPNDKDQDLDDIELR